MPIELSPQSLEYVRQQVALGRCQSPEEMVDAAINALHVSQEEQDELRNLLRPAIEEADRGETRPASAERIKQLGRPLLASLKETA